MRIIAHIDMDAFFAAVEERDKPWISGSAVVVGSDPNEGRGRGVVSTANYRARTFGIHSAMPISTAWRLSEKARHERGERTYFVTPNFGRYSKSSKAVMEILRSFSPHVEVASVDEAYIDLSVARTFDEAEKIAKKIKLQIWKRERLTCSIGVASNKMLAKIAAGLEKPNGLVVVREGEGADLLAPLSVSVLPGVGAVTEKKLRRMHIDTVAELRKLPATELRRMFGKWGGSLYKRALGIDDSPLSFGEASKSIGEQETFIEDVREATPVVELVTTACKKIFSTLQEEGFTSFRTVVVVVRFSDFETKTRSHTLLEPCNDLRILEREALQLLLPFFDKRENPAGKSIRLAGVRIEKFTPLEIKHPSLGLKDSEGNMY